MAPTQEQQVFSVQTPLGKDILLLRGLSGEEMLSGLFRFQLEMESEDPGLGFADLVGLGAGVTVELADGTQRFMHGVVSRFVQLGQDARFTRYRAELRPWPWLLGQHVDCRIFQQQSVPEILQTVFDELGLADYRFSLTGSYAKREYCVQYNESTLSFMCRLLEEEGIFYFFEHEAQKHVLVVADDLAAFKPCPGADTVRYGDRGGSSGGTGVWRRQNVLTSCTLEEAVVPGAFAVDDFNFETPSTDLMTEAPGSLGRDRSKRRIYEYPGRFEDTGGGEGRSSLRMEEQEHGHRRLLGSGFCRAFLPGFRFQLEDHYRSDVNAAYVLRRISHRASEEGYQNHFEAFPADLPFRPPRVSRKPVIPGTQTAQVVGKAGEEIWTDKYGRVKVQFHWDQRGQRNEDSSCWVRVAHGWAGKSWGWITLPRIGQEVVVSFLEGDPDRPLITGSVYNAEQTVPYALPANQTRSTWKSDSSKGHNGSNEIRFEDRKGEEEIYVHAQKDENIVVENDKTEKVGHDETIEIGNDRSETVKHDETLVVQNDRSRTVQNNERVTIQKDRTKNVQGQETLTVDKNQSLTVKGDRTVTVDKRETRMVKQAQKVTVDDSREVGVSKNDTLTVGKKLVIDAGDEMVIKVGKAKLTMKKDGTVQVNGKDLKIDASGKITGKASSTVAFKGSKVNMN